MPQKKEVPFFGEGLIEYRRDHTIELQGDDWRFYIRSLAVEGGITTTLFTPERQRRQEKVRLDWSNIVNNYGVARMSTIPHIYEEGVSFEERLERMYIWASAIKIYDSLMIDLGKEIRY